MDLIITILPVVTKDLPPRFTPYNFFYRDASSALLQLVNRWLNFHRAVTMLTRLCNNNLIGTAYCSSALKEYLVQ